MRPARAAQWPAVNKTERGQSIERRARAMQIYETTDFEEHSARVGRRIPRNQYSRAIKGEATDTMYAKIEDALTAMEEATGHDEPSSSNGPLRAVLHDVYGVGEIIAEGGTPAEVAELVKLLIRNHREDNRRDAE